MKTIMTLSLLAMLLAANAVFGGQTVLIDFGNAASWRGVATPAPDVNGNYWNSVWSGAFYPDLIGIDGIATMLDFGFAQGGAGGTDSYNGPAGVTTNPPTPSEIAACDIDAAALGNLGVKEATMDFYTTSRFEIQGLDPAKTYNLTFFGSHKYSRDATTVYSVYTDNTYSAVVDSASLNVAAGPDGFAGADLHNRDTVVTISDIGPQDNNILYVKFIGINGHDGYLNCMQIEEALGVNATHPVPRDGAINVPLTTHLQWTKPADYTPVEYVLRFRASNSPDPNWIVVDPVADLALDADPATAEAAVPLALSYGTKYDWKVTSLKADDPNEFTGSVWSFTTQPQLAVEAGPNIITWLNGSTASVQLNGSIVYPGTLTNRSWSVVTKPASATVTFENASLPVTTASFDMDGDYVLRLWARDSVAGLENEDTAAITVSIDACEAAKANPAGYTPLIYDSNEDCKVDLADFSQFAADWLVDLALTENLEY